MFPGENIELLSDKEFYGPMGKRFEAFRRLIGLTREKLAAELDVPVKTIEEIEKGEAPPDLCMLDYLNKNYGLDINWMIHGEGVVIFNRLPGACQGLNTMMKLPGVEKIIFAKMEQVKVIFKDRIEAWRRCQELKNNGIENGNP